MDLAQSFQCNTPDVVFENFGDESILLNLQSGKYYSLDPLGMAYWEWLIQGVSPEQIASRAAKAFQNIPESEVHTDLISFVQECIEEDLLTRCETVRQIGDADEPTLPAAYSAPVISTHDDVADMLLLDPVHDVSEAGWPQPAGKA